MDRTLYDHVLYLEEKIQALRAELTEPRRVSRDYERIEAELNAAETALAHYRAAFNLEQKTRVGSID